MEKPVRVTFTESWLCEAIRLKESQWGPQDDSQARRLAQNERSPLAKIITRAQALSQTSGLMISMTKLNVASWYTFFLILGLAIITGVSSALAALGNGLLPINIVWVLLSLLGLNVLALIIWSVSMLSPTATGGRLAQLWPWLTRKLAHGPDMGLAVQAWWSVWHQAHASRWLFSVGTHFIWLALSLAATIATLFALSTRQYDFVWETTVLSAELFVQGVDRLGVIPQWLGFSVPSPDLIRASSTVSQDNTEVARKLWSGWLLGCLIVYGVLPRLFLLLIACCVVYTRRNLTQPDLSHPYYVAILNRLPSTDCLPEGHTPSPFIFKLDASPSFGINGDWQTTHILIAIEPDPNDAWPPEGVGQRVTCLGPIDSRESRHHLLNRMTVERPKNLALVCDARHSPDRGTLRLIQEFSETAKRTLLWLRHSQAHSAHTEAWLYQLRELSTLELNIRDDVASVMHWFERHHD